MEGVECFMKIHSSKNLVALVFNLIGKIFEGTFGLATKFIKIFLDFELTCH